MPTERIPLVGKDCTKCGVWKLASEFSAQNRNKSGLQSKCRDCGKLYRATNREKIAIKNRTYMSPKENRQKGNRYAN